MVVVCVCVCVFLQWVYAHAKGKCIKTWESKGRLGGQCKNKAKTLKTPLHLALCCHFASNGLAGALNVRGGGVEG